ncbi:MAG: carbohydrate ABC transporter permease [Clostridiales bacterium]|nr:carbohydrate ABC transporter permease [Clostridiales bacterium]
MTFKKSRETTGETIFDVVNILIMILLLLSVAYPIWYILVYSFDDAIDASKAAFMLFPRKFTLYNYNIVFKDKAIFHAFAITVLRTVVGTVSSVFFTAMVSYGLSKKYLIGRKIYMGIGIVTLVFSAGMIPSYFVIKSLHLLNSFWVYIIPGLFSFYNALIFISFFKGLPDSIEESAQIDGANEFTIFLRIIIPLSMPVIATIALFNGVGQYNDYFTYVLYITDNESLRTMQNYLYQIIQANTALAMMKNVPAEMMAQNKTSAESLKYASMVVTCVPIVIVYPFLQKYFIKGVLIGSVKG